MANAQPIPHYLANIQVLRGIAAMAVVALHVSYPIFFGLRAGDFGVDLFFVISGFVMTHIVSTDPTHFLRRRIVRIVPLYWLITLLLFVVVLVLPEAFRNTEADVSHLIRSLLFIPYERGDGQWVPILYLGWTLNYEAYFYLLIGVALLFLQRRGWGKQATLAASMAIILVCLLPWGQSVEVFRGFYASTVAIEFVYGVICYRVCQLSAPLQSRSWLWLGLLMLVVMVVANDYWLTSDFQERRYLIFGLPSLVLVAIAVSMEQQNRVIRNPALRAIGDASYSIYLCHMMLIYGLQMLCQPLLGDTVIRSLAFAIFLLVASAVFGVLLFRFVEYPMHQWLVKRVSNKRQQSA